MTEPTRTAPFRMKATWWLGNRNYLIFMLRELSPVFMVLFLFTFIQIPIHLLHHPESWGECTAYFRQPGVLVFNMVALAFSLLHTVTWFQAATTVLPVVIAGKPFPPKTPPPEMVFSLNLSLTVGIAMGIIAMLVLL